VSYSFNVRADSVLAAGEAAFAELDKVSEAQRVHARDRAAHEIAVGELLSLVAEPGEGRELSVSVSGSCYGPEGEPFQGVSLSVNIAVLAKTN